MRESECVLFCLENGSRIIVFPTTHWCHRFYLILIREINLFFVSLKKNEVINSNIEIDLTNGIEKRIS